MRRLPSVAAIAAAVGTLGLIQIPAVSIDPPWWARVLIAGVLAAALFLALRPSPRRVSPAVERLERDLPRERCYEVTAKRLRVAVEPGISRRRDALLQWETELVNRSKWVLGAIELRLIGDVPVSANDLVVWGRIDTHKVPLVAAVNHRDAVSPIITIALPTPGLAPSAKTTLAFEYVWPAIAHAQANEWVVDLRNSADSSPVAVTLDNPRSDAQIADVRVYRRRHGALREHKLGYELPRTVAGHALIEFEYTKRRGDVMLILQTRPFLPGPHIDYAAPPR